ncbi:MAG: type 2 lanthipeptide synthetase LanM family protein [Blastocatellia bacterium]
MRWFDHTERIVVEAIDQHVDVCTELIGRICEDATALASLCGTEGKLGRVAFVTGDVGDTHRGGRSVSIVGFENGCRVVYKPRSLGVEARFYQLLGWLEARGFRPTFRRLAIVERQNYGWAEFVEWSGCNSLSELAHYYERLGGLLAVLYALEAVDLHYENLVAVGSDPILIDLEGLFHPRILGQRMPSSAQLGQVAIARSVLRTGLLPNGTGSIDQIDGVVDLSGLSDVDNQVSPWSVQRPDMPGTDELRLVSTQTRLGGGRNVPTLLGKRATATDFCESIISGFRRMYSIILTHRRDLLSDDGPIAAFKDQEVRVIARRTSVYGRLLDESYHPDTLREALSRDLFFDRLWVGAENAEGKEALLRAERAALRRNDIPAFYSTPGSVDTWDGCGQTLAGFLDDQPLHAVAEHINSFDESDLWRQEHYIRATLATTVSPDFDMPKPITDWQSNGVATTSRLIQEACIIADSLARLAVRRDQQVAWVTVRVQGEESWSLAPAGNDLYGGIAGIALFFGYLGFVTGRKDYQEIAEVSMGTIRRSYESAESRLPDIGMFDGSGGLIYVCAHLAQLWNDRSLVEFALQLVDGISSHIQRDEHYDVIGGSAGCALALCALYRVATVEGVKQAARQCGDHLLEHMSPAQSGVAWKSKHVPWQVATVGYSHGSSGIRSALLNLWKLTEHGPFKDAADLAREYERQTFCQSRQGWRDLRVLGVGDVVESSESFPMTWCHGTPGIALALLSTIDIEADATVRSEIESALALTMRSGVSRHHCLCHGTLGNIDLLVEAGTKLRSERWLDLARRAATTAMDGAAAYGWVCGTPNGAESVGLLTGLAGIGYQLLRIARPHDVPSVLSCSPPLESSEEY